MSPDLALLSTQLMPETKNPAEAGFTFICYLLLSFN